MNTMSVATLLMDITIGKMTTDNNIKIFRNIMNNCKNLSDLYDILSSNYFMLFSKYGRIFCITALDPPNNIYNIGFTEYINIELKYCKEIYIEPSVIYLSEERFSNSDLLVKIILKKLIVATILEPIKLSQDNNFLKCINFDKCDTESIKSLIDSTINEFKSTSLIDLIKKYNIKSDRVTSFKNALLEFIKSISIQGLNKQCTLCETCSTNIEIGDISSSCKMLIMTDCCDALKIIDIIDCNSQIEIII